MYKKIIITESQYKRLLKEVMVDRIDGDINIKGNELTSGGDVTSEWGDILNDLDNELDKLGIKYEITAGNDKYHQTSGTNSRHKIGCAVDWAIRDTNNSTIDKNTFNSKYKKNVYEVMNKLVSKYASKNFSFLDEYNESSSHATGGHIHMSLDRKWCGDTTSGKESGSSNSTGGYSYTPSNKGKGIFDI